MSHVRVFMRMDRLTARITDQQGLTLTELLAVMAILGVLAGIVAGGVRFVGSEAQSKRLLADQNTIQKAASGFQNLAFPQAYPVVSLADTADNLKPPTDLGVRLIDFKATLPQDSTRSFVPDFLGSVPQSAARVSWRIDTNTGGCSSPETTLCLSGRTRSR